MANINDYLIWRGDLPINSSFKFNEIDSMILARFSYLLFNKINMKEKETIESISNKMKDFDNDDFNYNGDKELITNLGQSNRFKDMIVSDYIKKNDKKMEKQFSAITIHISDKELYVSYIGTDKSILGWKEDFNMSFMEKIPAQIEGYKYLNNISKKYPNKQIRIGGHSKGGNIAIYSSITVPEDIQNKIIKVYNYDGPGFEKSFIEKNNNNKIAKKICSYIPQDSIIGRILYHIGDHKIIYSIEKGILQHDIYSWQVIKNDIVTLNNVTHSSELINSTLHEWLKNSTPKQRKIFVDAVFEIFNSTEANTFGEFSTVWLKNIPKLFSTYKEISDEEKKIVLNMLRLFAKSYFTSLKESENDIFNIKLFKKDKSIETV